MSHGSNEDDDGVSVGDGGEVLAQAYGGGVEGEGCGRWTGLAKVSEQSKAKPNRRLDSLILCELVGR